MKWAWLIGGALAIVAVAGLLLKFHDAIFPGYPEGYVWIFFWTALYTAIYFVFIFLAFSDGKERLKYVFTGVVGATLGLILAIWVSPESADEAQNFTRAQGVVSVLVGSALATWALDSIKNAKIDIFQILRGIRALLFLSCFGVALTVFYIVRITSQGTVHVGVRPDWLTERAYAGHYDRTCAETKRRIYFSGASEFGDDSSVEWSLLPASLNSKAIIDQKSGVLSFLEEQPKMNEDETLTVRATSLYHRDKYGDRKLVVAKSCANN